MVFGCRYTVLTWRAITSRLTREMLGRRVNLAIPEECLLINKSTGEVSHTGGTLMTRDSERYQTLMRWLQAGARNDSGPVPEVTAVEIFPKNGVLDGKGHTTNQCAGEICRWNRSRCDVAVLLHVQQ